MAAVDWKAQIAAHLADDQEKFKELAKPVEDNASSTMDPKDSKNAIAKAEEILATIREFSPAEQLMVATMVAAMLELELGGVRIDATISWTEGVSLAKELLVIKESLIIRGLENALD